MENHHGGAVDSARTPFPWVTFVPSNGFRQVGRVNGRRGGDSVVAQRVRIFRWNFNRSLDYRLRTRRFSGAKGQHRLPRRERKKGAAKTGRIDRRKANFQLLDYTSKTALSMACKALTASRAGSWPTVRD